MEKKPDSAIATVLENPMTVYYQHIGEKLSARDFPRTIGTPKSGLVNFHWEDISNFLTDLDPAESRLLKEETQKFAGDGFQIWGIPSGAKSVIRDLEKGDYLLLLETIGPGGSFAYVGRVIGRPSKECFDLSLHLWGESRFPLIVFLKGALTSYPWFAFCEAFGLSKNWNPAGNTYRVTDERWSRSQFESEKAFITHVVGSDISLETKGPIADVILLELAELDIADEEGRRHLRTHVQRERSSRLVAAFKRQLETFECCVCGTDFEKIYGLLGQGFVEAHHVKPIASLRPGEKTRINDLVPVCSNCHRMIHRRYPQLEWQELKEIVADLYIKRQENLR